MWISGPIPHLGDRPLPSEFSLADPCMGTLVSIETKRGWLSFSHPRSSPQESDGAMNDRICILFCSVWKKPLAVIGFMLAGVPGYRHVVIQEACYCMMECCGDRLEDSCYTCSGSLSQWSHALISICSDMHSRPPWHSLLKICGLSFWNAKYMVWYK